MKKLLGRARQSLNTAAKKGADRAKKAAQDPETRDRLLTTVTNTVSSERARKIAEAAIGKERTDKVVDSCGKAYKTVDKTVGEGRLDGAFKSARSAVLSVPVAGKALPWTVAAAAAGGFVTRKDVVSGSLELLIGSDNKKADEAPEGPKAPKTEDVNLSGPKGNDKADQPNTPKPPRP